MRSPIQSVLRSGVVQGIGAIAGILLGVVLARRLGPENNGIVSSYRNMGELYANVAVFGLPQAFVYFVTSGTLSAAAVVRFGVQATAAIALLSLTALAMYVGYRRPYVDWSFVWIMLGGFGLVVLLLARGLLLARSISIWFDVVSIAPNLLALIACSLWPAPSAGSFVLCLSAAYGVAGVWSAWTIVYHFRPSWLWQNEGARARVSDVVAMVKYGVWAWLPQILSLGTVFMTYRALGSWSDGNVAIGLFSCGLVVYNLVQGPLGLFVPALMRHWSGQHSENVDVAREYGVAAAIGNALTVGAGLLFVAFGQQVVVALFGPSFIEAVGVVGWLLAAAVAGYHCRLMSSMLYARGRPQRVARGFGVRFAAIGAGIVLFAVWMPSVERSYEWVASIWAVAEWLSALDMAISLRREAGIGWRDIMGTRRPWSGLDKRAGSLR